jgi:Uma2 family endonuclease
MGELGLFEGQRVQLIGGEIIQMSPIGHPHSVAVSKVEDALKAVFGKGYWVRVQQPLHLPDDSEPEPDVAVAKGDRDAFTGHPTSAVLVVEVSDTTLGLDRKRKAGLYARAGVADYWVVNLIDRQVEVHRSPKKDKSQPFGYAYADVRVAKPGETLSPLAAAKAKITVKDVLP